MRFPSAQRRGTQVFGHDVAGHLGRILQAGDVLFGRRSHSNSSKAVGLPIQQKLQVVPPCYHSTQWVNTPSVCYRGNNEKIVWMSSSQSSMTLCGLLCPTANTTASGSEGTPTL